VNIHGRQWRRHRLLVLVRDRYRCRWCGKRATCVDHVVPRAFGGSDDLANLVASCTGCNSRRAYATRVQLGVQRRAPMIGTRRVWRGAIEG